MRHHFTDHARERAEIRYGRYFSVEELNDIYRACIGGRALCGRMGDDGTTTYRLALEDGLVVCPVVARQRTFIVTFMPSDYFAAGNQLRYRQAIGQVKQVFATAKSSWPRPYRRERINLRDALEEG